MAQNCRLPMLSFLSRMYDKFINLVKEENLRLLSLQLSGNSRFGIG